MTYILQKKKGSVSSFASEYDILFESDQSSIWYSPTIATYRFECDGFVLIAKPSSKNPQIVATQRLYIELMTLAKTQKESAFWQECREILQDLFPSSFFTMTLHGYKIDDNTSMIPMKPGHPSYPYQKVHIKTYWITNERATKTEEIAISLEDLYELCKEALDISYLQKQCVATKEKAILLILLYEQNRMKGIRVTKLKGMGRNDSNAVGRKDTKQAERPNAVLTVQPKIEGAYACSDGYGSVVQAKTEEILRTLLAPLFSKDKSNVTTRKTSPMFYLWALPTSQGFWQHMGFHDTGARKKDMIRMSKSIFPK